MLKPYFDSKLIEAGVDEVGRGCLAGPVVAAAVILPKKFNHQLLNDSKKMKESDRLSCELYIKENAISWAIAEVSPLEIDQINILQASFRAMHLALDQLIISPEHILVDGNRFNPYRFIAHTCIIKGDSKMMSIAAASVLAKCYRDRLMTDLGQEYPHYLWHKNVGYPTIAHRKAIAQFGTTPYHRMSFRLLKQ